MINPYIQVFLAIVIVVILFITSMIIYNQEMVKAIRETGKIKKTVPVFSGIIDFKEKDNIVYDTLNPNAPNYINMGNSVNQVSGGEYSYNFWLYIDNTKTDSSSNKTLFTTVNDNANTQQVFTDSGLQPLPAGGDPRTLPFVLFLRGSNQVLEYKNQCSTRNTSTESNTQNYKQDILVKSPLVKLEHGGDVLTVEFNTVDAPDVSKEGSRNTCTDIDTNWGFINQNKIGLKNISTDATFSQQWFMVTIVLQDTLPSDPYPVRNKIRSKIFINGTLKLDKYVVGRLGNTNTRNPLKMNQGNLIVSPLLQVPSGAGSTPVSMTKTSNTNFGNKQIMMADLTYFNYALSPDEISGLFSAQFNTAFAPQLSTTIADSSYLTVSNNKDPKVKQIGVN